MSITRRSFFQHTGLLGAGAALTACGGSGPPGRATSPRGGELTFWYWPGGLSDAVVKQVAAAFTERVVITPELISGDFKQRLMTSLSSKTSAPDITGVKGEDMPAFLTQADHFLDLNRLGARQMAGAFAPAKYAQASTPDGRQLGLPIDLGPTALFLRQDLWARAGLPTTIAAISVLMSTWDGWFETAGQLKKKLPGTFAIRNSSDVFGIALAQQPQTFVNRAGDFIGDRDGVKVAWDLAVRSVAAGLQAGIYDTTAFNAALSSGALTGHLGPAWNGLDIESGAPQTSGAWRVAACPGGPANLGGSYLTLTSTCRQPDLAFAYIAEVLSPANEGKAFTDASVFPAVTGAYTLPALTRGQPFYDGQATIEIFGPAAQKLPAVYDAPANAAVSAPYFTELSNVEGGKDPERAWADAVAAGMRTAQAAG
jgi:cellobiose transport system substrate-binding protein